jgi:hypothetical protein
MHDDDHARYGEHFPPMFRSSTHRLRSLANYQYIWGADRKECFSALGSSLVVAREWRLGRGPENGWCEI